VIDEDEVGEEACRFRIAGAMEVLAVAVAKE